MKKNSFVAKVVVGFRKVVKSVIRFIDKFIVLPITKGIVWVVDRTGNNGNKIEKILIKKNVIVFLSLVISIGMFFFVDSRVASFVESSAEVLYNQEVTSIYNEEAYIVEGIPETVDVTLIGRDSDLYLAKQLPIHEIVLDLTGLKPGTHKVALKYKQSVASIDYKLDPSTATVVIYNKESEVRNLTVDILNQDDLDPKLVIDSTVVDRDEVIIKGAAHTLDDVATVKALVDINNIIDPNAGEEVLTNIPLVAYDESGNIIDCEIVPSKVSATITISSPQKSVPIKIIPVGDVSFGKAIASIVSNKTNVTIYGEAADLDAITYVPIEVDVDGLSGNKVYNITIEKPVGVNSMSVTTAKVTVSLVDVVTKEVEGITLKFEGLGSGLSVKGATQADTVVNVILNGAESVINSLDTTTINAYIDLTGLGVGTHEVEVKVTGEDLTVEYVPKVKKVNVVISKTN